MDSFLIVILVIFLIWLLAMIFIVPWSTHIIMVKDQNIPHGWASFQQFKDNFDKYNWDNEGWQGSWFDRSNNSKYHASIVQFDGKGMILRDPISWQRAKRYAKQYGIKKYGAKKSVVW